MTGTFDPAPIRLVVVDDHRVVLDGLELLLRSAPDLAIEGMASPTARPRYNSSKIIRSISC